MSSLLRSSQLLLLKNRNFVIDNYVKLPVQLQRYVQKRYNLRLGFTPKDVGIHNLTFNYGLMTLTILILLDYRWIRRKIWDPPHPVPSVDNPEAGTRKIFVKGYPVVLALDEEPPVQKIPEHVTVTEVKKKPKVADVKESATVGFRDRKIIEYENRIRAYSTPDKIFRYFATLQVVQGDHSDIYMTPDDFLRSITPGIKQPDGLGLDQYRKYDPKSMQQRLERSQNKTRNSIFHKLGNYGLISFSDYVFLLTVLSTSRRHFIIAFRMFDLNGDGNVDCEEFDKVAALIRQQSSIGNRHRDHPVTGNTFKGVNSALTTYFFGTERTSKLTIARFLDFQRDLQREILTLEFERKHPNASGMITEADFADLLLVYARYPSKRKAKVVKRVRKQYTNEDENAIGISIDDYLDFFNFLSNINDVDMALTFYRYAGAAIDPSTLKHVARVVTNMQLSDHVIDVVFTIFDENQDGQLSHREFVAVMKNRLLRGLEKPKDTGFVKFIETCYRCTKQVLPSIFNL